MNYTIRKMKKGDCAEVTHVITVSWNETYSGIVPNEIPENVYYFEKI